MKVRCLEQCLAPRKHSQKFRMGVIRKVMAVLVCSPFYLSLVAYPYPFKFPLRKIIESEDVRLNSVLNDVSEH